MFGDLPGPVATKPQRMADALVSISQDSLELPNSDGETAGQGDPLVAVLVDGAVAGDTAGEAGAEIEFGPGILEHILCMGRCNSLGWRAAGPLRPAMAPARYRLPSAVWWLGGTAAAPSTVAAPAIGCSPTTYAFAATAVPTIPRI